MSTCPLCEATSIERIQEPWQVFRHLDFSEMGHTLSLNYCSSCTLFFIPTSQSELDLPLAECSSKEYAESKQTAQTKLVADFPEAVSRSFLQAELIRQSVPIEAPRVLDIGCFDGALLQELDKRFPGATLHGFDVNAHLQAVFPDGENFTLFTDSLAAIEGTYDLICISHSLIYIADLTSLMLEVQRLLKDRAQVFTQNTHVGMSPFFLLLGDQYNFFTPKSISRLFARYGFSTAQLESEWFPREFATLSTAGPAPDLEMENTALEALGYLQGVSERLTKEVQTERVGILGTTANAAFVSTVLSEKEIFFVDENISKSGNRFRNADVLHPESLVETDFVIIPFGKSSEAIGERFREEYKGTFLCV